jgi:cytidine deaminase
VTGKADNPGMGQAHREELIQAAREAAGRAYAPYSDYHVGAALLTASGEIVSGCNVENGSYGLSICAERNAVFAARARGLVDPSVSPLRAVAIYVGSGVMPWPCGACRQVLKEFAGAETPVYVLGPDGIVESTLGALIPNAFFLGKR